MLHNIFRDIYIDLFCFIRSYPITKKPLASHYKTSISLKSNFRFNVQTNRTFRQRYKQSQAIIIENVCLDFLTCSKTRSYTPKLKRSL